LCANIARELVLFVTWACLIHNTTGNCPVILSPLVNNVAAITRVFVAPALWIRSAIHWALTLLVLAPSVTLLVCALLFPLRITGACLSLLDTRLDHRSAVVGWSSAVILCGQALLFSGQANHRAFDVMSCGKAYVVGTADVNALKTRSTQSSLGDAAWAFSNIRCALGLHVSRNHTRTVI